MTRLIAVEWSRHRIRVNAIGPTHIRTPLIDEKMREEPVVAEYFRNIIPLGRPGEPEDVVGAAIYLAPAASSVVTGHVVFVEGGHTVR